MAAQRSVLVHIHVSQGDHPARASSVGATSVHATATGAAVRTISSGAPAAAPPSKADRSWAVAFHGTKYLVLDHGTKGLTITHDGTLVWTGRRLETGAYETRTTTIPNDRLDHLLRLVRVGDARTPKATTDAKAHEKPERHAAPRSGARSARTALPTRKREVSPAQAEALARGRAKRAKHGASTHSTHAPSAATPSSPCPPVSNKRRTQRASAHSAAANGEPKHEAKRRPGRPRKAPPVPAPASRAKTSKRAEAAPPTTRSTRGAAVHDAAILKEVRKKVERDDPANASSLYDALRRIWLAGGREAALAWKDEHGIASVVDAYSDWVDQHPDAARAMLEASPTSKRSAAA